MAHCAQTQLHRHGARRAGSPSSPSCPRATPSRCPVDLPTTYAALVEPFAVGLHGVHSAEIAEGEDVSSWAGGGVGLTTLAWALHDGRRARHGRGSRPAAAATPPARWARPMCWLRLPTPTGRLRCVDRVRRAPRTAAGLSAGAAAAGRIVISGACDEPTPIEPITALLKELTIRYSVAYRPDEFRDVIAAFADGAIDPTPMIGPTFESRTGSPRHSTSCVPRRVHGRVLVVPVTRYRRDRLRDAACSAATPAITA